MKHGDKAKAKTAKASSKASVKKASKSSGAHEKSKAAKSVKTGESVKAGNAKAAAPPVPSSAARGGNGRSAPEAGGFTNPAVAAAFKRAVKKYPNAFRRLTD